MLTRKQLLQRENYERAQTYLFWMEQQLKFIEIHKLFTILLWHRLFPVRLYCSMSKLMEFAFLGEEESCWCFAVAHSLSSSPLLKHVDMILGCVEENVSKSTIGSAEVDRNNDISLNWSLRSHGFQNIPQVMQTETIIKSKEIAYIQRETCRRPRNKCSITSFYLHQIKDSLSIVFLSMTYDNDS